MIKGIVFDCFGVLAEDGWKKLNRLYLNDKELYQQAHDLNKQSDLGLITYEELYTKVAELVGTESKNIQQALESEQKDERLFALIAELRVNYKIGLLSNVGHSFMETFFDENERASFDATVLSSDVGYIKPDVRAYQKIAEKLHLSTEQCVMIDDRQVNCDGAVEAGMQAILYTDFAVLQRDLRKILAN